MYLVKLSLPVFDGPDPLLDGRLDAVGRELLLRDLVVVAGVDSKNNRLRIDPNRFLLIRNRFQLIHSNLLGIVPVVDLANTLMAGSPTNEASAVYWQKSPTASPY